MACQGEFGPDTIALVLFDIVLVVALARALGLLFRKIGQPSVVAEILAGIALGPSVLGALPGNLTAQLFPCETLPPLTVISTLGLLIFMFIVGLELDLGLLRGQGSTAAGISLSSIALPFTLGIGLAAWLYSSHDTVGGTAVDMLPFALFIGVSMSVTAFPVLARILAERGMRRTRTGTLVLASAAIDDLVAWILLAAVVAVTNATSVLGFAVKVAESIVFVVVMFTLVRPLLARLVPWRQQAGRLTPDMFAIVLLGILVSSLVTDRIGLHLIFGAFLFGTIMPRRGSAELSADILVRVEQMAVLILLPVFFIVTGLLVNVTAFTRRGWVELVAVLVVACVGKFVGAAVAARFLGVPGRRSAAIGILMNTRGLTELVVLSLGYKAKVLDHELYSILVVMAVVTTLMTTPILKRIYPDRVVARDIALAERAALNLSADHRVIAVVTTDDDRVVDAGTALLGDVTRSELVLSRFDPPFPTVEVGSGLTDELAAVAATFESTQALADHAANLGARVMTTSRFSGDVGHDVVTQAQTADADVVVLDDAEADIVDVVLRDASCAIAVLSRSGDPNEGLLGADRVVARPAAGDDGVSAVEHACRVAVGLGVPLVLVADDKRLRRRALSLRDRITTSPLDCDVVVADDDIGSGAVTVVGRAQWLAWSARDRAMRAAAGTVLVIRAAVDDHGERFNQLLSGEHRGRPDANDPTALEEQPI